MANKPTPTRKPDPTAAVRQARARERRAEKLAQVMDALKKIRARSKEEWIRDLADEVLASWIGE